MQDTTEEAKWITKNHWELSSLRYVSHDNKLDNAEVVGMLKLFS